MYQIQGEKGETSTQYILSEIHRFWCAQMEFI